MRRTFRKSRRSGACGHDGALCWSTLCQLCVVGLLLTALVLTVEALIEPMFTLQMASGIGPSEAWPNLGLELGEANRTEALLPLTFAIARGALAGPGLVLEPYEQFGQAVLSGLFFLIFLLMPLALLGLLLLAWLAPLSQSGRRTAVNAAVLCQSWNSQEILAAVLLVARSDLEQLTAFLADTACEDAVSPPTPSAPVFRCPVDRQPQSREQPELSIQLSQLSIQLSIVSLLWR